MSTSPRGAVVLPVILFLTAGAAACTGGVQSSEQAGEPAVGAQAQQASQAAEAPALDDADVAAIVVAANTIDIRYGELARERASNEQVKRFAETMIKDHTAVNQSASEVVARLGVTPTANDVSRSLESQAEEMHATLMTKSGADFDKAYIDNEVAYHRAVLQAIDETLIPSASNAELKQTITDVRPAFEAHLQHAEAIQSALAGGA